MIAGIFLVSGIVGGLGFIIATLVAGVFRQDYSTLHQPVSLLSLGPTGWIQTASFVVTGFLMMACAAGLRLAGRGVWGPLLVGVYGLGLIGAGIFPIDPSFGYLGTVLGPAHMPSLHGRLHDLTSAVVFASLTAACFVFARRFYRAWTIYSMLTGVAIPTFLVFMFIAWFSDTPTSFSGLYQRASIIFGWVWISALSFKTLVDYRRTL